jgi:hypothetical protein
MRSLLIMAAAAAAAAISLSGCRDKKPEPVPGPQSVLTQRTTADAAARGKRASADCPRRHHGVSGISWFQGTLEEAFSPRSSGESRSLFRD